MANYYTAGIGWGEVEQLGRVVGSYNPEIAFDANGNALAAWGNKASHYTAENGWSTPETIGSDGRLSQIAVDASGNAFVTWDDFQGDIWINRYTVNSGWGGIEAIENEGEYGLYPLVGLDADGNGLLVWKQAGPVGGSGCSLWSKRYVFGSSWGSAELIEPGEDDVASAPQLAVSTGGSALAVWRQSGQIWSNTFK